jgi:hypothetical protein
MTSAIATRARSRNPDSVQKTSACCAQCISFETDALVIEAEIPGLRVLSSGFASVRASDGLCRLHERLLSAASHCAQFEPRAATSDRDADQRGAQ